jgi:homoserine dehydrogenase
VLGIADAITRYQVRLRVADRPGVLAQVAQAFATNGVSIEAVRQSATRGSNADLLVVTHAAREAALAATVATLGGLGVVEAVLSVLRVEGA